MKAKKLLLCLLSVFFLASVNLQAQEEERKLEIDKFSIGLNFGSLLHYGDVKQYDYWPTPEERKWGFGAVINYQISPIFSVQAQGLTGNLAGIKRNFKSSTGSIHGGNPANLKFDAEIYEGSFNATISLNRWWAPNLKANDWLNVYAVAGIGLVRFRSQLRDLRDDTFINSYGWSEQGTVEEDMTTETVVPLGLGLKIKLHDKIDFNLESTIRNVNTDKLDAYVRTNNSQDKYGYTSIGFTYRIGKRERHMEWLDPDLLSRSHDVLSFDEVNSKIDAVKKKVSALEEKIAKQPEVVDEEPVERDFETDFERLAELNEKLIALENRNQELNNRIENIKTSTVTETVTTIDGQAHPILISVFFEVNKSNIDRNNAERVAAAAKMMMNNPDIKMELVGHADRTGGQRYNELLSERRARSVYNALVNEYGIDSSRLSITYRGFAEPLSKSNLDVNRRVDFIVK